MSQRHKLIIRTQFADGGGARNLTIDDTLTLKQFFFQLQDLRDFDTPMEQFLLYPEANSDEDSYSVGSEYIHGEEVVLYQIMRVWKKANPDTPPPNGDPSERVCSDSVDATDSPTLRELGVNSNYRLCLV